MSGALSFFGGLLGVGIKAWLGAKEKQAADVGVNQQKAVEATDAVQNAESARTSDDAIDRLSDGQVRDNPAASYRD